MIKKYPRICTECNEVVFHSSVDSRSHSKNVKCLKCSHKDRDRVNCGNSNGKWSGYEEVSLSYFNGVKSNAKKRNLIFDISMKDIWNQFIKQNKKCIYTGLELQLPRRTRLERIGNASLDRIDSTKGYIQKNVQWVHKDINWMKQDFEQSYFVKMCDLVSTNELVTPIDIFIRNNLLHKNEV